MRNAARFSAGSTTMRGCTAQLAVAASTPSVEMRHRRHHHLERRRRAPCSSAIASPNTAGHPPDLAAAAARQHQQHRRIGAAGARLVGIRAAARPIARSADGRHSCRAARRAAMHLRLERQQRQHVIDIARAWRARGPAATPRPTARRSRRSGSTAPALRTRRAIRWVKSGLSMMTSTSGRAATAASRDLADVAKDRRQTASSMPKPMNAKSLMRDQRLRALRRHLAAADADQIASAACCALSARISAAPSRSPRLLGRDQTQDA